MTVPETTNTTPILPLIDLNKDRREERRQVLRRSRRHGVAILAVAVTAGGVLLPLTLQAVALRHELRKTDAQVKQQQTRLQSLTATSTQLDGPISLWERLGETQRSRRAWGATFPALAACLPQDVFLQQAKVTGQGRDVEIQLQGSAGTMTGLRAFTSALARSPMFAGVHLDEATTDRSAGHSSLSFRITGPITTGAVAASPEG